MNNELTINPYWMGDISYEYEGGAQIIPGKTKSSYKFFDKKCNGCDGANHTINIHFTKICPYRCSFCIDKKSIDDSPRVPDVDAILETVIKLAPNYKDVLIVGGEPMMFPDLLWKLIKGIRRNTELKIYVTSSIPDGLFPSHVTELRNIISEVDGFNWSIQHINPDIARWMLQGKVHPTDCELRRKLKVPKIDRHDNLFYKDRYWILDILGELNYWQKRKIRINLNLMKPWIYDASDLIFNVQEIDKYGFGSIKISELQNYSSGYVSFEDIMGIKLPSPYSHGCITDVDMSEWIPDIKTPVILKRSCFLVEKSLKASFSDGLKVLYKRIARPENDFVVVYEDGHVENRWK